MSDDLTTRARRWLTDALPHNPRGLVSELADEVDRLRKGRDEWAMQWRGADDMFGAMRAERDELIAEHDEARAALGRVRALNVQWREAQAANRVALAQGGWTPGETPTPDDYDQALEGES